MINQSLECKTFPAKKTMFRIILALFLLVALPMEVLAQRGSGGPRGGGPRGGGPREGGGQRPPRSEQPRPEPPQPETQPEVATEQPEQHSLPPESPGDQGDQASPVAEKVTLGPGTVPQLAVPADQFAPLSIVDPLYSDTIIPTGVPYKVIQYTNRIMKKYDLNENGFLEREEWSKMPGKPQSIDMDGDFVLSLEELVRFIAQYGKERTIHRPNPPLTPASANWNPTEVSVFKPLSAPPKPKTVPTEAETGENQNINETDSEQVKESDEPSEELKNAELEGDPADKMEQ